MGKKKDLERREEAQYPPLERDQLVTFTTRRGSFWMSDHVYQDEEERALAIAEGCPRRGCMLSKVRDGDGWLWTWKFVLTHVRELEDGELERMRQIPSRRWTGR